jgi:hypothetical protein
MLCKVCLGQRDLAAFADNLTPKRMEALRFPRRNRKESPIGGELDRKFWLDCQGCGQAICSKLLRNGRERKPIYFYPRSVETAKCRAKVQFCVGHTQVMKTLNTLALLATLVFGITPQVGAGLYNITFNDGNGNVGSGQIDVEPGINYYYAASGALIVTAGKAIGAWNLYTASGSTFYPNYLTSPAGAYYYNNSVYVTGQNPQYPASNPLLDNYGLLFTQANGNELNLWANADGTYTLGGNIDGWQNFNVTISFGGTSITPVPEPINCALAGFGLLFICGGAVRFSARKLRRGNTS